MEPAVMLNPGLLLLLSPKLLNLLSLKCEVCFHVLIELPALHVTGSDTL